MSSTGKINKGKPKLFPRPPGGRQGWPWTTAYERLPEVMADGRDWPHITLITPSYNQGQFLEATIRSVLLQGYTKLEYFVVDGGSSDQSTEIISKYAPWISRWISEDDRGQAHAINKGLSWSTGELWGWLNSDDILLPAALKNIAIAYREQPASLILGDVYEFDQNGYVRLVRQNEVELRNMILPPFSGMSWHQPGVYVPCDIQKSIGFLDDSLRYAFDQEWMCRLLKKISVQYLRKPVAAFRLHDDSKSVEEALLWWPEQAEVMRRHAGVNLPDNKEINWRRHLTQAMFDLRPDRFQRRSALAHLMHAVKWQPMIFFTWDFWRLLLRALTPVSILLLVRRLIGRCSRKRLPFRSDVIEGLTRAVGKRQ